MAFKKGKINAGSKNWIESPLFWSTILLIAAGVIFGFQSWKNNHKPAVESFFSTDVNSFCVNDFCFNKDGSDWLLTQNGIKEPANADIINSYTGRFGNIKLDNLVSNNSSKFVDYGIGVSQVILKVGGKQLEIGGANASYDGTYVREVNTDKVYDINVIFDKTSMGQRSTWENKTISNWPSLQISSITLNNDKKTTVFSPVNGKWDDQTFVDKVVHLTAVNFWPNWNSDKVGGTILASVIGADGNHQLAIGQKEDKYWATTDKTHYYEISKDDYLEIANKLR